MLYGLAALHMPFCPLPQSGKSIVIAMLAIFMVRLHGMNVLVLENNEVTPSV